MTAIASYVPGTWVAVSAPGAWLLVALPPDHSTVQRCWSLISSGGTVEDILDALVSGGIRATPDFALVRVGLDGRALARGAATITITDHSGAVDFKVTSAAGTVWADETFSDGVNVLLLAGDAEPASQVELPMASGVTMAASIRVRMDGGVPAAGEDAMAQDDVVFGELVVAEPPADIAEGALEQIGAAAEPHDAAGEQTPPTAEIAAPADVVSVALQDSDRAEPDELRDGADDAATPSYDFLFGATQRPLPTAAPSESSDAASPPEPGARHPADTAGWSTIAPLDQMAAEEPAAPEPPEPPLGLIDAVPWGRPEQVKTPVVSAQPPAAPIPVRLAAVPPLRSTPLPGTDSEEIAQTVDRAKLLASGIPVPTAGPTVLAGYCPVGHLSPPYAAVCRVCGATMPANQLGFEIARPSLGVLRLATGTTVALDRGVLLGRAPQAAADASDRPHLVRLVSPENDVSRNHAEIVIDGWHVYVKDLGSTNGTVVTLPGQAPVRLRPDDLQLLDPGSLVTLADEVTVTFEVTS